MRLNRTMGAQKIEHVSSPAESSQPDWESVRIFLEVARANSFRTAAQKLNMTGHGIANRVTQLETRLNTVLFTRHRDGVRLTDEGQQLLSCAEQMEEASIGFLRRRGRDHHSLRGEVRIAATEGLGTFWLTPKLMEFIRAHPQILTDLHCSMQRPDDVVLRAEADLAIQIEQPAPRDLTVRKIGRMHIMPCASQAYLKLYGTPTNKDDLPKHHRIAMMYADQGRGMRYYNELFPGQSQTGFMAMRTDVSTALYAAIVNGLAVGWLPTYCFALADKIVPLDIGCIYSFDIWLTYHPDLGKLPRVRRMIDWMIDIFEPKNNPWFRDDFIHPKHFGSYTEIGPVIDTAFGGPSGVEKFGGRK